MVNHPWSLPTPTLQSDLIRMSTPCAIQREARLRPGETFRGKDQFADAQVLPKWLIPADRRGWRRVVQNFTPSWV